MASPSQLNQSLLRPCIIQILRATGFHSARPSVIETLTDITARFVILLASRAVYWAQQNHRSNVPDIADIRLALTDCGMLSPNIQASQEVWKEILRQPLDEIPERNGLRSVERTRRDDEDTEDVQAFVSWFGGPVMEEIGRIAGQTAHVASSAVPATAVGGSSTTAEKGIPGNAVVATGGADANAEQSEDFLTALKKKHSKTGDEARFQGTVLGVHANQKPIKIEGGPSTLNEWMAMMKEKLVTESSSHEIQDVKMDEG